MGNYLQFDGGKRAGFAAADVVQAFPVVGTIWGVLLFDESKNADKRTLVLIGGCYLFYSAAAVLLGLSAK